MKISRLLLVFCAVISFAALSCKNGGQKQAAADKTSAAAVYRRVENLMKTEVIGRKQRPDFYTDTLINLYREIDCLKYIANDVYMDFQWTGKVLDVCNPVERTLTIEAVRVTSENRAEADMYYEDPPCYEFRYTLFLEFNGDDWYIADVLWKSAFPIRETQEARQYIDGQKMRFQGLNRKGLDKLLDEVEEWAPSYNEGSIFKEAPEEVAIYLDNISNLQKLLKKNPNYKPSYDGWFASFREKVKKEAAENGVDIK